MVDFQSRDTRRDSESASAGEEPSDDGSAPLGFAVVTVGSGRTVDRDSAGDAAVEAATEAGEVMTREVIESRYDGVQSTVGALVDRSDVDVLVTVGGTGVAPDDITIDAVEPLLDKHLPGVGELIRRECAEERGSAAVRTRATGGILDGVPVFCLPGDPSLARRAARAVVIPEAEPLVGMAVPTED
ncbi:MAG: molybdenum cofactor biosynthesis protein B [Salinirussus sp.]